MLPSSLDQSLLVHAALFWLKVFMSTVHCEPLWLHSHNQAPTLMNLREFLLVSHGDNLQTHNIIIINYNAIKMQVVY